VHDLVDIVSKNGNLLLNVGPRADGVIPDEPASLLRGLGQWLALNGEAIYGTRPWTRFGEGPTEVSTERFKEHEYAPFGAEDVRFTTKGEDTLYAICLGWPGEQAAIASLAEIAPRIAGISMLGNEQPLAWSLGTSGLRIECPSRAPCDHAVTFKISLG
jgi:alpha-L-fucosidase